MTSLRIIFNEMRVHHEFGSSATANLPKECDEAPSGMIDALKEMGVLAEGDRAHISLVSGTTGIYRVELGWGTICVKRAMPKARLAAVDPARPVARSNIESEWLKLVRVIVGEAVPEVLGDQPGMFAMEFLDPGRHTNWATQLEQGDINPSTAAEIGRMLGRIHAATANNFAVAQRFSTDRHFHRTRIEPLLLATAQAQPQVAEPLKQLAATTQSIKLALVHGDCCPNNFQIGPKGPILLDADYAWYGDPAFDVASCLSHLLVACIVQPRWRDHYLTCYTAFCAAYAQRITWEMPEHTDERAAALVPALVLAHACGRIPHLQRDSDKDQVTEMARALLLDPVVRLGAVREAWRRALSPD